MVLKNYELFGSSLMEGRGIAPRTSQCSSMIKFNIWVLRQGKSDNQFSYLRLL